MEKSDPKGDITMKKMLKKTITMLLLIAMVASLLPAISPVKPHEENRNQQNNEDRANKLYNTTWFCKKTLDFIVK